MRYALTYGGLAGTIAVAVIGATIALDLSSHGTGSVFFGYLVMLVALSLIFVGIKRYRDVECGGIVRFGRAFALGLGMAAVAGAMYVIGWEIYLATSGYDFMAAYTDSIVAGMRAEGSSQAAIDAKLAEMRELSVSYRNPLFRIPITFIEIFPVGLLVALVSATLLRNPKLLPARA